MGRSFLDVDPLVFSTFSADEAVEFVTRLLWSSAHRYGLPLDAITVSARVNVADGGVDADIRPNAVKHSQDLLAAGNSFFQIKAGATSRPWQKRWLQRELLGANQRSREQALGKAVRECLRKRGRYVLVCFGCDPTGAQRRTAIRHIRDIFTASGFRRARVDVWGQKTLAALVETFPSLILRFSDHHHLPFLTLYEWRQDAAMSVALHLGALQKKVIEEIRECLRGGSIHHVRLIGEPGLGKTRLALEALSEPDLAPTVIYVRNPEDFEHSPLFNALLRADDKSAVTLVIDDCPERDRASVWNALRQRSERIRLVSLDHGPETSRDELMKVIHCPPLDDKQIQDILGEYTKSSDLGHWADFCSGSPRVAHAVGENLRSNPDDILRPPATVPIWDRFIRGRETPGTQSQLQHDVVLRHIALFQKFGFEPPVEDEAKFVWGLVALADPTITWSRFQSIVKHFRDRRVLQGKTTLFFVPRALHIHLWLQYWEHYGSGTDVRELLDRLPESLLPWFSEMFKFGHASAKCQEQIEQLTGPGGPFDSPGFITAGKGAEFLNDLAEAHPDAVLRCIERSVGGWSRDDLARFSTSRQHIVWALEKIAIWQEYFHRAAMVLLKLAGAENASNSNNATGTFCGLFEMGFGRMASSEAPPNARMPSLRRALQASDSETRDVGIKALGHALADHPYSRMSGPERQGMRPMPKLWVPRTWKEVHDVYRTSLGVAMEFYELRVGHERSAIAKVIIDASSHLLRRRAIEKDAVAALRRIADDAAGDLRPIVQHLSWWRSWRWKGLSRRTAAALREIDSSLQGSDLAQQLTRVVLLGSWEDMDRSSKGEYGKAHATKLSRLAHQAIAEPSALRSLLPRLSAEVGFALWRFGHALGTADKGFVLYTELLDAFEDAGEKRNAELLSGYLGAMFDRARSSWESSVLSLLGSKVLIHYTSQLVVGSGMSGAVLDQICECIESRALADQSISNFAYARRRDGLSQERCMQFILWCVRLARPVLVRTALDTAFGIFCFDKPQPPIPETPLLDLITAPNALQVDNHTHYQWAQLTDRYVDSYPRFAMSILESVLLQFVDHAFVLRLSHSQAQVTLLRLIAMNPSESWSIVARQLESPDSNLKWHVAHWLGPRYGFGDNVVSGPLSAFNVDDVLRWVAAEPTQRAHFIARECPKSLDANAGGALTRQILIRYGDQEDVRGALSVNFGTEGWSGKASDHYRSKRDKMRQWLSAETEMPIVEWLQREIDWLTRDIKSSEIREEREF